MEPLEIGSLRAFPFGAVTALALAAGAVWSLKRAADAREKKALEIFWLLALPLGLFLAHLGYALCNLDMIEDYFGEVLLDFAGGGYLLYGALAGAVIALVLACRITGVSFEKAADLLAGPFLLLGTACALGEGLIGGGFGWKVEDWFLAENSMSLLASEEPGPLAEFFSHFPFAVRDPFYGYASWAVFLPVALCLGWGLWKTVRLPENGGGRAVFALSFYAAVRVLYESLRQDDIPKWGFVRVNQILSAAVLLALLVLCAMNAGKRRWPSVCLLAGGAALVLVMEFALEKKIGFLEWMTMDLCYAVSAAGCWMMFQSVNRLRKAGRADSAPEGKNRIKEEGRSE